MKTRISAFCDEYENLLIPIDDLVEGVIGRIEDESRGDLLEVAKTRLSDARHRFQSLREKIEHQQAYLIIFGPLKSGKSTLMNAISGAYVSEVTAMPAYPCLVYVSHGEETAFSAIKYNGTSQEFDNSDSLAEVLEESHSHLASRIRMHEVEGEEFDPRVHYTEAVRRIDVKTPVPSLREASTVLVDTPGLYSRMKFGYDLMTREFRDSAACAVFVVRSDNLFLDQVFDEFTELLDEFSRIFLVINIDSSKLDLQPDGSLKPSIESSDPDQIVEAFKSLSMTAPLRDAYETGRLQIYPVDLLNAAAGRLSNDPSRTDTPSFDTFVDDLTDYLNSSDYLREFETDSLKLGASICAEVREVCNLNSNEAFEEEQFELKRLAEELPSLMEMIDELSVSDMAETFDDSRSHCLDSAVHLAKYAGKGLPSEMAEILNGWMESDGSFQSLLDDWNQAVDTARAPITTALPKTLASQFDTPTGGAKLDASLINQLQEVGLDLETLVRPVAAKLKVLPAPMWEPVKIDPDQISVNRSLSDRLLFRSQSKIRQQSFGIADNLDRIIPSRVKRKRLAEQGFMELYGMIDTFFDENFPGPQTKYVQEQSDTLIKQFSGSFEKQLESIRIEVASQLESTNTRMAADDRIFKAVERLNAQITEIDARIGAMQVSHLPEPEEESDDDVANEDPLESNDDHTSEQETEEHAPIIVVAKNSEAESASTER
ncbi:MAG: GTPase SAR1 family protein [Verrucomicrobiales bacterium]|jgi:GTPase SAR1 family protein